MRITILFTCLLCVFLSNCKNDSTPNQNQTFVDTVKHNFNPTKIADKAKEAKVYCKKKKYNEDFCFLVDMNIHSGLNRFFIWDFKTNKITNSMLVGHGCYRNRWSKNASRDNPVFSNIDGSHCSSLGKYKIADRGVSEWGIKVKYNLIGLDSTNSNASKRFIVLHSWEMMSENEIFPKGSPEGWGCPTLSNGNMKIVDSMLRKSKRPTLLWVFK